METPKLWFDSEGDYRGVVFDDVPATLEEITDEVFEQRAMDGRPLGALGHPAPIRSLAARSRRWRDQTQKGAPHARG